MLSWSMQNDIFFCHICGCFLDVKTEILTWLLNKHRENAEGHLHGLLQTLITNLP